VADKRTDARKLAELVDAQGRFGTYPSEEYSELIQKFGDKAGPALYGAGNALRHITRIPRALRARDRRTEEEMDELAREVNKGKTSLGERLIGMKKGGKVSVSSRADGIAKRGKTRGKMV